MPLHERRHESYLKSYDFGALGVYSACVATGTWSAGAQTNAEIFQFRYTGSNLALIRSIRVGVGSVVGFAAGLAKVDAMWARAWTVDGSGTGSTTATLTTNNAKLRTSMGTSGVGAIRAAGTVALTGGTRTLDAQAFAQLYGSVPTTAGAPVFQPSYLFNTETESEYPPILAQNEGFIIRITLPATGTWSAGLDVKWMEAATY